MVGSNDKKKTLKERAERMARKLVKDDQSETIQVVVFYLGSETYAIETSYVNEIYPFKDLTVIPGLPSFVQGIINVRRKILSVIDLKYFLDISKETREVHRKVLILEYKAMSFAILTDGIEGVRSIPIQSIQPSLPTLTGVKQDFLKGLTTNQLIILDGKRLLEDEHLIIQNVI